MQTYSSIHLDATEQVASRLGDTPGSNHVSLSVGRRTAIGYVPTATLVLPFDNGHAANATLLQALADEAHTLAVACDELAAGGAA